MATDDADGENTGPADTSVETPAEHDAAPKQANARRCSELCDELDASKGTVHTYLATLEAEGLVAKDDGRYRLGLRLVTMGETVRNETPLYRRASGGRQTGRHVR